MLNISAKLGFGTRHIVFSKDGNYFYVVGELSSQINVVKLTKTLGDFENIATYKTIPADFTDHNGAAALYISQDGKYVYTSNRGHNSIAVFKVNDDHTLSLVQRVSTFVTSLVILIGIKISATSLSLIKIQIMLLFTQETLVLVA